MAMELRGASPARRVGAIFAGLLLTGGGQFVLGNHRRGAAYVALSLASSLAMAGAAFVSPTLMATLMLWSIALFLFSILDVTIARPAETLPRAGVLVAVLIGLLVVTRTYPFAIRAFLIEAFRIPSASMAPTLESGDYVFLDKLNRTPERGDVVVFHFPKEPSTDYVKRVIGLPGDLVVTSGNSLSINGEPQPHVFQKDIEIPAADCEPTPATLSEETLTGGRAHAVLDLPRHESNFQDGTWKVPDGELFLMGDNRDNSMDSRQAGTVPFANVRGVAMFVYFSFDACETRLRTERFGEPVR